MRSFKNHISLILPLFIMMFCFEILIITNKGIATYEGVLSKDLNVVLVSNAVLDENEIKEKIKFFSSLKPLNPSNVLERLKDDVSKKNLAVLQASLPKFYTLKLDKLLDNKELRDIKTKLLNIKKIKKVETFAKAHDKIYKLLKLIRLVLYFFLATTIVLSFILFLKQMKIWLYEHTQRLEILCLLGAPFSFRAFMLYRIILIDCFIAFILTVGIFSQFYDLVFIQNYLQDLNIDLPHIGYFQNLLFIFLAILFVCFLCVNFVMIRVRK